MTVTEQEYTPSKDAQQLFDTLDWNLTPDEIRNRADEIITYHKKLLEEMEGIPKDDRTFINTFWNLNLKSNEYGDLMSTVTFPGSISINPEVRQASTEARQKLSSYFVEAGLREETFQAVQEYLEKNEQLNDKDRRLVDYKARDFRRQGFDLEKSVRDQLKLLWQEDSNLAIEFRQNVNEDESIILTTVEEMKGVPSNIMASLDKNEEEKFIVEMTGPNVTAILSDCTVEETRKRVSTAWNSRSQERNTEIMERLIKIRHQAAELLGYDNHAAYVLEVKMAETPEKVNAFLDDMVSKLKPHGQKEIELLSNLKRQELGETADSTIYHWDRAYYTKMWKEVEFNVDMESVKNYLPLSHVLKSMLDFYQEIFGFDFVHIQNAPVWHEDVTCYAIYDTASKDFKGIFYLDLYPRPGTFGHAAAFTLIRGRQLTDGTYHPTASAMVANFNKPTADAPSLLTLNQVRTLFHEFGHIIHQTTTTAKHSRFSGSAVQRDFVEAPSQMLENWIYEDEVITRISKHYETGESLPLDLVERLREYDKAMPGLINLRQLFFGKFDMACHTTDNLALQETYNKLAAEISLTPMPEGTNGAASFGHIAGGYDAGYYGYMWSDVIAQDLYTRFAIEGPTSKQVGMDYRKYILEPGSEVDTPELIKSYLGREFNNEAFMRHLGLQ